MTSLSSICDNSDLFFDREFCVSLSLSLSTAKKKALFREKRTIFNAWRNEDDIQNEMWERHRMRKRFFAKSCNFSNEFQLKTRQSLPYPVSRCSFCFSRPEMASDHCCPLLTSLALFLFLLLRISSSRADRKLGNKFYCEYTHTIYAMLMHWNLWAREGNILFFILFFL